VRKFTAEVQDWLGSMNVIPTLQIFAGDLNSDPKPTFSWKGAALRALKEMGYISAYEQYTNWHGTTYDLMVSFSLGGEQGLYDHIFYCAHGHADPSSLLYFCEPLHARTDSGQIGVDVDCPSDHLPLLCTFNIPL